MASPDDEGWQRLIAERGGLGLKDALDRAQCPDVAAVLVGEPDRTHRYRPGLLIWLIVRLVVAIRFVLAMFGRHAPQRATSIAELPLGGDVQRTLLDAATYATLAHKRHRRPAAVIQTGDVLVALASIPGAHLRLLANPELVASAARLTLGIGGGYDRVIVRFDGLHWRRRRFSAWLQSRASTPGAKPLWSIANLLYLILVDRSSAHFFQEQIVADHLPII